MKRLFAMLLCLMLGFLLGCGSPQEVCTVEPTRECHTYMEYGLLNPEERNPAVRYAVVEGNVVWSVIFSETVVVPILLIGFHLYEPVTSRTPGTPPGVLN